MALEGTLEDFSLADIFQLIALQRKTGILSLKRNHEAVTVKFHNGMVIGADSSPRKLEDRIGRVLEKTGLITEEQLKDALEYQQKTLQKIGFILVDQNYITREQLQDALQIQVSQMIYRLFRWHKGEYYFDQKARVDLESDENIPPMSAESILMEGIQMIDEWPIIEKRIPNFNMIFRPTVELSDIDLSDLAVGDSEFESAFAKMNAFAPPSGDSGEKIRLTREEAEIFLLVDGKNSVTEVIESSKLGEFHTCKALYDLLERKIVEPMAARQEVRVPSISLQITEQPAEVVEAAAPRTVSLAFAYPIIALVALAAVLLQAGDPLRISVVRFLDANSSEKIKQTASYTRLQALDSAVLTFYYVVGRLPKSIDEVVKGNFLDAQDLLDPWTRPFEYEVQDGAYVIFGHTADGRPDEVLRISHEVKAKEPVDDSGG